MANQKLIASIRKLLDSGYSEERIVQTLVNIGCPIDDVHSAISDARKIVSHSASGSVANAVASMKNPVFSGSNFGFISLILAVAGLILGAMGFFFLIPIAVILGVVALYKRAQGLGIAITIVIIISFVFNWYFLWASGLEQPLYLFLAYFNLVGVLVLITFVFWNNWGRKKPNISEAK